jgi:membrane associated rhomboid family serine protease
MLSRRQTRFWALVLKARLIPCRVERQGLRWQLLVPASSFAAALTELRQYETENRNWPPPPPRAQPTSNNLFATIWVLIALAIFHDVTLLRINLMGHAPVDWVGFGNAHAGRILEGEWWRLATALTLHSDWLHLASNILIGGVFIVRLCRDLGSGPGWSLLLASGISGNLINAWLQSPDHRAVGASTAIFGAVGVLAAISLVRYRHNLRPQRRWALPIAAALGLLAMLGAGGEQTDLGAHLFGFLSGMALGAGAEILVEVYGRPGRAINTLLNLTCMAVIAGAWYAALSFSA